MVESALRVTKAALLRLPRRPAPLHNGVRDAEAADQQQQRGDDGIAGEPGHRSQAREGRQRPEDTTNRGRISRGIDRLDSAYIMYFRAGSSSVNCRKVSARIRVRAREHPCRHQQQSAAEHDQQADRDANLRAHACLLIAAIIMACRGLPQPAGLRVRVARWRYSRCLFRLPAHSEFRP